jgi:hypothetical protein
MVTRDEILMGRDKLFPLSSELEANLHKLLGAINKFREKYGHPLFVSSGYRPGFFNAAAGGAKKSNHMICLAVDFKDPYGTLDAFCMENPDILEDCGLWQEHPDSTPGWCHLQAVPPRSGNRVFRP